MAAPALERDADPGAGVESGSEAPVVGRVALAFAIAAGAMIAIVTGYLAAYPAFLKFSLTPVADLGTPWHIAKSFEFALSASAFAVLLPLGLLAAAWAAPRLERAGREALELAVVDVALFAALLFVARLVLADAPEVAPGATARQDWVHPLATGMVLFVVALGALNLVAVLWPRLWPRLPGRLRGVEALMVATLLLTLDFLPRSAFSLRKGLVPALLAAALIYAWRRFVPGRTLPARTAAAASALVCLVCVLLLVNAHLPTPGTHESQKHAATWTLYVGPANSVLHGGAMLVDVFGQYGPGPSYLLAGIGLLTPLGLGTLAVLSVVLDLILFAAVYGVLRLADIGRVLAAFGLVAALFVGVYAKHGTTVLEPNRPLRLVLPLLTALALLAALRSERRADRWLWGVGLLLGLTSIFAVEVFFYAATGVLGGVLAWGRIATTERFDLAWTKRAFLRLFAGIVAMQALFAVATLAGTGSLPSWSRYLHSVSRYASGGGTQQLTPLRPGAYLGAFHVVSAAAVVAILIWRPELARARRRTFLALATIQALAVAEFSYYAGQSAMPHVFKVAPLAAMVVVLWLGLVRDDRDATTVTLRTTLAFVALWFAFAGLIAVHLLPQRLERSALVHPLGALHDVRHAAGNPPMNADADAAVALLRRAMPGPHPLVLLPDGFATEVEIRADRVQPLPSAAAYQDSMVPERVAELSRLAQALPTGTRFLTTRKYLADGKKGSTTGELDAQLIHALAERFAFVPVAHGPHGLTVYALAHRR